VATHNNVRAPVAGMVVRLAGMRERGYVGAYSSLAKFPSLWRPGPPAEATALSTKATLLEKTPTAPAARQISPQVSAALLSKFRTELSPQQPEIVDDFKQQCLGFAVMRELVLNSRSIGSRKQKASERKSNLSPLGFAVGRTDLPNVEIFGDQSRERKSPASLLYFHRINSHFLMPIEPRLGIPSTVFVHKLRT
jgi:hypothetical protein